MRSVKRSELEYASAYDNKTFLRLHSFHAMEVLRLTIIARIKEELWTLIRT